MIKMFIGNEEVVSNHEFTINEEMLSASSTILNNCYPASWELDKDYISKFYYPKDYSKFILADGEYRYGNTEFTIFEAVGKNLFDGLLEYGSLSMQGNPTTTDYAIRSVNYIQVNPNTTYTISCDLNYEVRICEYANDLTFIKQKEGNTPVTFTTTANTKYIRFATMVASEQYDIKSKWQVELGSVATSYIPYGEQVSFETNVEKEVNSYDIYGKTYQDTRSGKNLLELVDGTYSVSGASVVVSNGEITLSAGTTSSITLDIPLATDLSLTNGEQYTISAFNPVLNGKVTIRITSAGTYDTTLNVVNKHQTITYSSSSGVFTNKIRLVISSNAAISNFKIKPQLEKGNTSTYWELGGAMPSPDYPSELISTGYKNLFDIDGELYSGNIDRVNNGFRLTKNADYRTLSITLSQPIPAGTYSISWKVTNSTLTDVSTGLGMQVRNNTSNLASPSLSEGGTTFTISSEATRFYIFIINSQADEATITLDDITLTKGNVKCGFVPYNKYGIEIKNIGKNLIRYPYENKTGVYANVNIIDNGDGTFLVNGTGNATGYFNLISANNLLLLNPGTYTLSKQVGIEMTLSTSNETLAYISRNQTTATFTITENKEVKIFVAVRANVTYNNLLITPQLEKGNQATEYEPYRNNNQVFTLNEPLRSIENIKDRLYMQNNTLYVERNVGSVIFTGNENWFKSGATALDTYGISNTYFNNITSMSINTTKSNYFMYSTSSQIGKYRMSGTNVYFYYATYNTTTLNDWKTWLSTHNTEVYYQLAEPVIEELGGTNLIKSYEGINNFYISSGEVTSPLEIYYYWKNYDVLFAGIVKNSGDISLNPRYPHYCSLQILSYKTFLSESDTLDYVISNKTIRQAIEAVVNSMSSYGFIVGNIDISSADDIIGAYSTLNKTAYDVLQYLSEISGSRWRTRYVDSSTTAIDFYDPDTLPQANDIEYTKEYWEDNNIVDLTFNYGTRDYRNKQIILSDEVYAGIDYTEVILSNGYNTSFITQQNVGVVKEILVNGVKKDVISQKEKELGADADFYYTPGKNIIESEVSYTAGSQVTITYTPLVKGRQIVFNNDEINRIAEQTSTIGVIARYENRNDIVSSAELEKIGETYIEYKGKAEIILTLTTQNKDLYNVGEVVYFNAPIEELKEKYMVKSKKIEYVVIKDIINLFYVYELTSSFNSEKAINYFDNQRNKAQGNIQEGQSITRNIDINSSAVIIWGNATINETTIEVVGDNVLNSALNSPFIE